MTGMLDNLRFDAVIGAIDSANAQDPNEALDGAGGAGPATLLYGQRMSAELARFRPDASELLKIAARGQHIERWLSPRADYPDGREGYLAWRKDLGAFHARRVSELMEAAGYEPDERERVGAMLRKEGIKTDPETQVLEDVIGLVFVRWYFADFARGRDPEHVRKIVAKTARKMSAAGRADALREFVLPADVQAAMGG